MTQNENETDDGNVDSGSTADDADTKAKGDESAPPEVKAQGDERPRAAASEGRAAPPEGDPKVAANRERVATIAIAIACVIVALFIGRSCGTDALSGATNPAALPTGTPEEQAAAAINAGLSAATPQEAVAHFQRALDAYPGHYGATFQLARALDRAGRTDEATKQWQRVLSLAERSGDQPLIETANARLAQAQGGGAAAGDAMAQGLDALYKKKDPNLAVLRFREVLAATPEHYGATFQLATALEQVGDLRGAKPLWDKMLKMAEATSDAQTIDTARAHIADIEKKLGPVPEDPNGALMREGLEALYTRKDPAAAADLFQKVLANAPDHYGATFQMATALDQLKKGSQAKPLWEKMLKMAEATSDAKTAEIARARLAQKP